MVDSREFDEFRDTGSFDRYELYVMQTLADLKTEVAKIRTELASYKQATDTDIATLKVKVSSIALLAGAIGGLIPVVIILVFK